MTTNSPAKPNKKPYAGKPAGKKPTSSPVSKPVPYRLMLADGVLSVAPILAAVKEGASCYIIPDLPSRLRGKYDIPIVCDNREEINGVSATEQRKIIACFHIKGGWECLHKHMREYECTPDLLFVAYLLSEQMQEPKPEKGKSRKALKRYEEIFKAYLGSSIEVGWGREHISKEEMISAAKDLYRIDLPDLGGKYLFKLCHVLKLMYTRKDPIDRS